MTQARLPEVLLGMLELGDIANQPRLLTLE
jgi:hypothetical protein